MRDVQAEQREFEAAVWGEYVAQAKLFELAPPGDGQQTYVDKAIDAMWFGWCLARKKGPCVVDGPCLLKTR